MRQLKKLKASLKKGKTYAAALDKATKLRFTPLAIEGQIKYGVPGIAKGITQKSTYLHLSDEMKQKALRIVDEECERKTEWKPKELPRLAITIEKRLKKECL
jgi:hypothetical protein